MFDFSFVPARSRRLPVVLLALAGLASCTRAVPTAASRDYLVYIGTNVSSPQENSIYLYHLSPATGELLPLGAMKGGANPTYLTMASALTPPPGA